MKRLPVQIETPASRREITAEVRKLLRAANVENTLPTPREVILSCARLVETGELDLETYRETPSQKAQGIFLNAMSKVLGFVDRRQEEIYVDPSLKPRQRNFITFHEVTHSILPWQHLVYAEDDEAIFRPDCSDIFESEANYGAAELLFQCERFEKEARDFNVTIASALHLADKYQASRHSSLRRFAERNIHPLLLLVLTKTRREHEDGLPSYYVASSFRSSSFITRFGDGISKQFLEPGDDLRKIISDGRSGEIVLPDLRGDLHDCIVEVFDNTYKKFALIFPKKLPRPRKVALFSKN